MWAVRSTVVGMEDVLPESWGEFGVGAAGATAALAGLLIVAISVNVERILASRIATRGASSTIASLVLALVASLLLLVPGQSITAFGIELFVVLLPVVVLQARSLAATAADRRAGDADITPGMLGAIAVLAVLQFVPFVVAGALLVAGLPGGCFALAAGVIIVIIASMVTAWALLIEVLR